MTLKQLKAFLVLARTLNYANAANELCLSQSALSLSIKTLEEELGGKLFKRNTRRVEITTEGQSLIPYAKKLLANWEIWKKMSNSALNSTWHFKYCLNALCHSCGTPRSMHDFNNNHPNISFSIHDITNEKIIEKVQEGIFEIGICFEPNQ
jgi:LysR family carnitine catabolism transcriptional activator